ncbi:uncharacterized protein LOC111398284 [Olea europaea var. sylvestris]|uniref:uncharacterized protein LOC111398284 n=1 Tax=Olea europaea var. sylvestris TaxID=158386 RepID=UPI000C1D1B8E|nr:uncharacterized protein LOC111398284 [Olea europaea var. sylvestris]
MATYLKLVLTLVLHFKRFELVLVLYLENTHTDALSKLSNSKDSELLRIVPIERLLKPSISGGEEVMWIESTPPWMQLILAYLKDQSLPPSKNEPKKLRKRAAHFILQDDVLYRRDFSSPLLRCVGREEAMYILKEIHEGVCVTTLVEQPCTQAKPLAKITEANTSKFVWKNIIYRFDIPHYLVTDNGRQFNNKKMVDLCDELSIRRISQHLIIPKQMGNEAVNKIIKHTLKRKLDVLKGAWVDELPHVV